jgi:hypothetical protein
MMFAGKTGADAKNDGSGLRIVPIDDDLLEEVVHFLHAHMHPTWPIDAWRDTFRYPWRPDRSNYGYALCHLGRVVGVQGVCYSFQRLNGRAEKYCNLHSWCVHPDYRPESLRLLLASLRQRDCTFTTLTASKATVPIMERFGFRALDAHTVLLPNPLIAFGAWAVRVSAARKDLLAHVDEEHRQLLADLGPMRRARAILATRDDAWCLCISIKEKRKSLPVTRVVYVSDQVLFAAWLGAFARSFLRLDRSLLTTCPARYLPRRSLLCPRLAEPRPAFFKSTRLSAEQVTCLYSELTR